MNISKYDVLQQFANIKNKLLSLTIYDDQLDNNLQPILNDLEYLKDSVVDLLDYKENKSE